MQSSPFCSVLGFCWACSTLGTLLSSKGTTLQDGRHSWGAQRSHGGRPPAASTENMVLNQTSQRGVFRAGVPVSAANSPEPHRRALRQEE